MIYSCFIILLLLILLSTVQGFRCNRRPYGTTTQSSPADGRFKLKLVGDYTAYLPDEIYTVQITATDDVSRFTGFMVSAEGDMKPDPQNPRRLISQAPGDVRPQSQKTAKLSDRCLYSVEQAFGNIKSSVEVYWQAPPSGSGCVTLRAMVAENDNVWFEDGGPLTQKICEDTRQPDDLAFLLNKDCQVCDEAKYEISFTGIWSRNTHPRNYPESMTKYSDLVGASHGSDFILWLPGTEATEGLKQLAEHANSSKLEAEIFEKIGDGVRTLIKGKGHSDLKMNLPTYALFRTDNQNHLISVAVAIHPSPDWFLGVARFELCQADNTWLQEREFDLLLWDAGTDSGVSYESPKMLTFPQAAVTRVQMSSYDKNSPFYGVDTEYFHPFGRLLIKLVRTYHKECKETTESEGGEEPAEEESEGDDSKSDQSSEPEEPSRYQNPDLDSSEYGGRTPGPVEVDPESDEDCPVTKFTEWSRCEGICVDGMIKGLSWRVRNHIPPHPNKEVSKYCKKKKPTFENVECEEECTEVKEEEEELTAEKRVMTPILPGQRWSKKRDLPDEETNLI